jgi:hypothetical protein
MNIFTGFGVLEYFEIKGGSLVGLISLGNPPVPKDGVQNLSTKQFWVRVPLKEAEEELDVDIGDFVELFGHIRGLVKTNPVNNSQEAYPQIVCKKMQKMVLVGDASKKDISYINMVMINAIIKWVAPIKDVDKTDHRKPVICYMQVSTKLDNIDDQAMVRSSDTIPVALYTQAKDEILKMGTDCLNKSFLIKGNVSGRITKISRGDGEVREDLNPIVSILNIQPTNIAGETMFISGLSGGR